MTDQAFLRSAATRVLARIPHTGGEERWDREDAAVAALLMTVATHLDQGWLPPGGGIVLRARHLAGVVLEEGQVG